MRSVIAIAKTPSLKASTRFVSTKRKLHFADRGAIAQLGERLDRTQEVAGSSPASSIQKLPANGQIVGGRPGTSTARSTYGLPNYLSFSRQSDRRDTRSGRSEHQL